MRNILLFILVSVLFSGCSLGRKPLVILDKTVHEPNTPCYSITFADTPAIYKEGSSNLSESGKTTWYYNYVKIDSLSTNVVLSTARMSSRGRFFGKPIVENVEVPKNQIFTTKTLSDPHFSSYAIYFYRNNRGNRYLQAKGIFFTQSSAYNIFAYRHVPSLKGVDDNSIKSYQESAQGKREIEDMQKIVESFIVPENFESCYAPPQEAAQK